VATTSKTPAKGSGRARAGNGVWRRWGIRAFLALVLGVSLGAGAGVYTVNKLEPGRGTGVDSLAVMLDSIARGRVPDASDDAAATRDAEEPAAEEAEAAALVAVPVLADLEEGAARNALVDAGLNVGEIQFQSSSKPAGTVLSSIPVAGSQVKPETPVALVLSDGRTGDPDTASTHSARHTP
jgi:serine/threonine-protein kinase